MLLSEPEAAEDTVHAALYVTLAPAGRSTVSLMLPEPEAVQVPAPEATQVQDEQVSDAGNVSVTVEPNASFAPAPVFDAVIA
jgi:hypothetical protein